MDQNIMNTKKANQRRAREAAIWAYRNPRREDDIFKAYAKPSRAKIEAWEYCKALCKDKNGDSLIISGHSPMKFSAVFKFKEEGTGRDCFAYITKDYDRYAYAQEA